MNLKTNLQNAKFSLSLPLFVLLVAAGSVLIGPNATARTWRNAYVSFDLPEKWNCTLESTEWVCRSTEPGLAEAIIILTAKEVGPQDSLANYEAHLKAPRTIMTRTGTSVQSTVYQTEGRTIGNHPWVNSLHFSSEVYNYYTRYLATTKDKIAVLVTFSAHKLHYTKYSADFFRAIDSLRVIATKSTWAGTNGGDTGVLGVPTEGGGMPSEPGQGLDEGGGRGNDTTKTFLGMALLIGAVGFYLLLKRRKKK
jgi:hypothetical protein